jgi:histidine phosphotransfer protein HptB
MSFEQALDVSLAAALGDDQALVAELRTAFLGSACRHFRVMAEAESDAQWHDSALRLKGLAASFGAESLMQAAARAAESRGPSRESLDAVERALVILSL